MRMRLGLPCLLVLVMPLALAAQPAGKFPPDSLINAQALRNRYYGRDAYGFGESSLNIAAFRLGPGNKFDEAFALLRVNEELFPASSGLSAFKGNISLMRADTTAAEQAFREAVRRDSTNQEAKGRLRAIGRP